MLVITILPRQLTFAESGSEPAFEQAQAFGEGSFLAQSEDQVKVIWHHDPRADTPMPFGFEHEPLVNECCEQMGITQSRRGSLQFECDEIFGSRGRPAILAQGGIPGLRR